MASLTEISVASRKAIRYGIYAIIFLVIGRLVFGIGVSIYKKLVPPKSEPPTVEYGKLTSLPFPEKPRPNISGYSLETPDGTLPQLPEQIKVYVMPPSSSSLGGLDAAKRIARALGFNPNGKLEIETIPNVFTFEKDEVPSRLTMNIVTQVFSISYNVTQDPTVIEGIPPSPEVAIAQARSYLTKAKILSEDLEERATHEFIKIQSGQFVPAISLAESDITKVNIYRKNFGDDEIPAVTPDPGEANVWFMMSGKNGDVVAGEYHYYPVDEDKSATYPIKTSQAAWEELQSGGGYIASGVDGPVIVRRVYLGYYDAGQYTEFYQPVIVFEGDNDFVAYVPAVTSEYYGE